MLSLKKMEVIESVKDEEVRVPKGWAMFSSAGNRSITNKAQRMYEVFDGESSTIDKVKAGIRFVRGWRRMEKSKSFREAGDTAVRECVWCFLNECCRATGIDPDMIWDAPEAQ